MQRRILFMKVATIQKKELVEHELHKLYEIRKQEEINEVNLRNQNN